MALDGKYLDEGGMKASVDLSSYQSCAVKISGDNSVGPANTGGEGIVGILMNAPASGSRAVVAFSGFPKVIAGSGGFTAGDQLMTETTTARLVKKTSTNTVVAIAVNTANAGEYGRVKLLCTG